MAADFVDEFYFSLLSNDEATQELFTISDEAYADGLQLQEVVFSSITSSLSRGKPTSLSRTSNETPIRKKEMGSSSSGFFCEICMEYKPHEETFSNNGCSHSYCNECVGCHIASKLQENCAIIGCPHPSCKQVIEIESFKPFVPESVFKRWADALSEASILGFNKYYCPFKDCSGLLEFDDDTNGKITQRECPYCRRMFCAICRVPWHCGLNCEEFDRVRGMEWVKMIFCLINLQRVRSGRGAPTVSIMWRRMKVVLMSLAGILFNVIQIDSN
ncbi:hypothetical protein AMTR_s00129p00117090 [Amborella trichopoda]|uniref:RBR-type E3 ubiquitin transferase n=1 Tax=Amborella trichopoda TaxID=13333 RepID=W1NKN1_AMBTC|nr:hypothetical protein AMTR_s00129p00117090 [Amborella trichopoda]